ncbi:MAG: MobC family plasmid mobilization relaxosome protein [Clostridia bacterium]|nr:MobC family plasmid mobilization relaxosome protein [Clostridia bacterium]
MNKNAVIYLRIKKTDKDTIKLKAQKAKMNMSEYMINSSLNTTIIVPKDNSEYITELRRIGNNINQIAKKVNQGIVKEIDFRNVNAELRKIWQLLSS